MDADWDSLTASGHQINKHRRCPWRLEGHHPAPQAHRPPLPLHPLIFTSAEPGTPKGLPFPGMELPWRPEMFSCLKQNQAAEKRTTENAGFTEQREGEVSGGPSTGGKGVGFLQIPERGLAV